MPKIFISYRREDTGGHARHLFEELARRYGEKNVFMDVATLEGGERWADRIDREVARSDAFIALIGRRWLDARDAEGNRRLDQPGDTVRREVASGLARDTVTIPVLVDGAAMPPEEELPDEIDDLARRNAVELTSARWDYELERLLELLPPPPRRWLVRGGVALAAVLLLATLIGAFEAVERGVHWLFAEPSVSLTLDETEPLNLLAGSPLHSEVELSSTAPARTQVRVSDISWAQPDGSPVPGSELTWSPLTPITLGIGDEATLTLTGTSPPPGLYELTLSLESKAGRMPGWRPLLGSYDTRSWPALDSGDVTVHKTRDGSCSLRSTLLVGSADTSSLRGEVVLLRRPGVQIVHVLYPGMTDSHASQTTVPGSESSSFTWSVTEVTRFKEVPFLVLLKGPPHTDWEAVARELRVTFDPLR